MLQQSHFTGDHLLVRIPNMESAWACVEAFRIDDDSYNSMADQVDTNTEVLGHVGDVFCMDLATLASSTEDALGFCG